MKRVNNLFEQLINRDNILLAIEDVNRSHRTNHGKKNKTVEYVESHLEETIEKLRKMILEGFVPSPMKKKRRWDKSARKWRDICEPKLFPDQYIHHMIVQVLKPVMMRGMDYWCCGSIPKRGTSHGIKGIKKWIKHDKKYTKYAAELDIHHFYDSIEPKFVLERMKELVKDNKMLEVIWSIIKDGIPIGAYCSQWFANTLLQPLDHYIREELKVKHYIRYMDNMTLFGNNKKKIQQTIVRIRWWLKAHNLKLKSNYQVFPIASRPVNALGFRFLKNGKVIIRKYTLLRIKRAIRHFNKISPKRDKQYARKAAGLLSMLSPLYECNSCNIRKRYLVKGFRRTLRIIVSSNARRINRIIKQSES